MKSCDEILPVNSKVLTDREYLTFVNLILLRQLFNKKSDNEKIHIVFDDLLLSKPVTNIFQKQPNAGSIHQRIESLKILLMGFLLDKNKSRKKTPVKKSVPKSLKSDDKSDAFSSFRSLLEEQNVHNFLRVNEFEGTTYFNKERFEELLQWILLLNLTHSPSHKVGNQNTESEKIKSESDKELLTFSKNIYERFIELIDKAEQCGYDFNKFRGEFDKVTVKKAKTKKPIKKRKKE